MKKTKMKIGIFLLLSLIGLIIAFFFSAYLNLLLSGQRVDDPSVLNPAKIIESLAHNERHRQLALCFGLVVIAGAGALTLMNRRETYEADTSPVAGDISTPVAIGQGQHGTARWLRKSERPKAFNIYHLHKSDQVFAALLEAGASDTREVANYKEPDNTNETNKESGIQKNLAIEAPNTAAETNAEETSGKSK